MTLKDFTKEEIIYLINFAIKMKQEKKKNIFKNRLKNKNVAMIFEKTSTRTRCATSVACYDEGAHAEFLGMNDIQMGKKESLEDTSRVLGRMYDAILFRGYKQDTAEKLYSLSGIPVINGLTDEYHPTQALADFMTVKEVFGSLKDKKLAFVGDGNNNVVRSLMICAAKIGVDMSIGAPKKLWPDKEIMSYINQIKTSKIEITESPKKAVEGADIIYTDVWVSMGEENNSGIKDKIGSLKPYEVNQKLMRASGKDSTIFLHCLPASHKNGKHYMEVTEDVFESEKSFVFDEAENRLHTIKAILVSILKG